MKTNLSLAIMSIFMLISSFSYASFPVERQAVVTVDPATSVETTSTVLSSPAAIAWSEDQTIAFVLWAIPVTGFLAGHRWFLGSPWLYNLLFIFTAGFFFVGWVIDGIDIITGRYPGL
ncbi:NINE protein [Nonlabens marinus]|uniref:TM2 domain-containing protein n=1 Tax=Nonlabens marinus S1-08 TaxID=1454201 RepID=W8VRF1_9FLAO|nr:NINE protein [Nonlabens marinus]BAO55615.1 hypothetical protein NMS_1606 [Nonlabens marinus S1-08]